MSKLLNYAKLLAKEGEAMEKDGAAEDAIPKYIKVVDILLLLAEAAPTYPDWTNYIGKAEFYQKKAKSLLTRISIEKERHETSSTVSSRPVTPPVV